MRFATILFLLSILPFTLFAQDPAAAEPAANLHQAFRKGKFSGHFRSFFMVTDNARHLSDYYALAAGGGLHFESAAWHGLSFGIGGVFHYNLASSDLAAKDSATGAVNRYEIGLFDVEDPNNKYDLDRMSDFWMRYQWRKSSITLGRQQLQTPFINYQDGRMRPTAEAGLWLELHEVKNTKIQGGWIWKISPRSTVGWYDIGESIGLYPRGLNPDGTSSGYPENLRSKGVAILGITHKMGKNTKIQLWEHYIENIFHSSLAQADYSLPLKNKSRLNFALQFTHQDALNDGGNAELSKTYFMKNAHSNALSAQMGWQRGPWQLAAAYTRVTADGRFLSPREWGREPFFTFMPRERIEGSGDSHSANLRLNWQHKSGKFKTELAYGHYYLPDVKNAALNKYAFPAFRQLNIDLRYTFGKQLEGLRAQFLYVHKWRLGEIYGNDRYVINKVDMGLYNLILNYTY